MTKQEGARRRNQLRTATKDTYRNARVVTEQLRSECCAFQEEINELDKACKTSIEAHAATATQFKNERSEKATAIHEAAVVQDELSQTIQLIVES
ncbi:hypothetical protein SLS54_001556 [Diplodia seriata]